MKLRDDFLLSQMGEQYVLVPVGKAGKSFHGVLKLNETAAFIVRQLQSETDVDKIVDALAAEYKGTREEFAEDVEAILAQLRAIGAIK